MKKSYGDFTKTMKRTVVGVLICTMGLMFYWSDASFAASAKDRKTKTVAPLPTQNTSEKAPSPTASPPPSTMKQKVDLSKFRKDLSVSHFTTSKYSFETGESAHFSFRAHNLGNTIIGQVSFTISVKWGGCSLKLVEGNINNLALDSYQTIERGITIPYGTARELILCGSRDVIQASLELFIDPLNTIAEEDEENNKARISTITYRQRRADLAVTKWRVRGGALPREGQSFEVDYEVKNIGNYQSPQVGCVIDRQVWRASGSTYLSGRMLDIRPLSPNETQSGSFSYSTTEGDVEYLLVIKIDPVSTVSGVTNPHPNLGEWSEDNNSASIRFIVGSHWYNQGI